MYVLCCDHGSSSKTERNNSLNLKIKACNITIITMRRTLVCSVCYYAAVVLALVLTMSVGAVDDGDEHLVTCGSFIKIFHKDTRYYLSSEEKQLGGGSGQQIVTLVKDAATPNALWWVRAAHHAKDQPEYSADTTCQLAEPIPCGTTIRLTHQDTMRNLHSHLAQSPLSRQQEVTGYGTGDANGDGGDNWTVECSGGHWTRETPVRFKHVDTGKYLGASSKYEFNQNTCGQGCPIMNHLESFARATPDSHTLFKVDQGIHLSR